MKSVWVLSLNENQFITSTTRMSLRLDGASMASRPVFNHHVIYPLRPCMHPGKEEDDDDALPDRSSMAQGHLTRGIPRRGIASTVHCAIDVPSRSLRRQTRGEMK